MLKGVGVEAPNSAIAIERSSRLPFSPHSDFSESSGAAHSYSPKHSPPRTHIVQNREPKQETEVKFEVSLDEIKSVRESLTRRLPTLYRLVPTGAKLAHLGLREEIARD